MRRADRLFQIVQNLSHQRSITAHELADRLEVSDRTIYRDMQDLSLSGIPISAEAGQGYRLLDGFHLPPLMFTEDELEALLLGARMVRAWTDKDLTQAAHQALQKIEHIIPEKLRPHLERNDLLVPDFPRDGQASSQLKTMRTAIRSRNKVAIQYNTEDGTESNRTIQPLGLFYWGKVWTVVGWCELRDNFRNFRLDRMTRCQLLSEKFLPLDGRSLEDYLRKECNT